MAFSIPGRQPSSKPAFNPFGSAGNRTSALGTPFGGQSGGVQAPSSFQQQAGGGGFSFGGQIRTPGQRDDAGFAATGGRTGPDGVWRPFSPAPQQPQPLAAPPVDGGPPADGGASGAGAPGQINTSINPTGVFTPDQTQIRVSAAQSRTGSGARLGALCIF